MTTIHAALRGIVANRLPYRPASRSSTLTLSTGIHLSRLSTVANLSVPPLEQVRHHYYYDSHFC